MRSSLISVDVDPIRMFFIKRVRILPKNSTTNRIFGNPDLEDAKLQIKINILVINKKGIDNELIIVQILIKII